MAYGAKIECWGDYACFTRSEMKVERVSYDIITPSAARGLAEAIFWHPGLRYVIDRIYLLSPIKFTNVRRNEINSKIGADEMRKAAKSGQAIWRAASNDRTQRAAMILRDVHYCIELHFEMTGKANASDNPTKFHEILCRRAAKGQCYHQPYFGCREYPASFSLIEDKEQINTYQETRDLGYMLYDMDYSDPQDIKPMFFHAYLKNGVMDLRDCEVHQ